jgi:hypothetical protein
MFSSVLGAFLLANVAMAQDGAKGQVILDLYDAAYLEDGRAGHVHTIVRDLDRGGEKILQTTVELHLTVQRFKSTIQLRMDTGTEETPEGKVVGVFMRQFLGRGKQLTITGTVKGKQLLLVQDGIHKLKPAPWNDQVVGQFKQRQIFKDKNVKPGDHFSFLTFEPSINLVIRTEVKVKDYEEVTAFPGQPTKRLLRVEIRPGKVENVQLPTMVSWLDDELLPVRSQMDIPGLGVITLYRTTRDGLKSPAPIAKLADIGINNFVRLNKRILQPYNTRQMIYRITVKGDTDPATAFSQDDRQQVKNVRGQSFELHVREGRSPDQGKEGKEVKPPADEFTQSSYFIASADKKVKEHARAAVGDEADPWAKARRIEKWVHDHMKSVNDEALATADHVARTLEGDCTEYSMLMAAMCRAAGVPSRTAIGLIYADTRDKGPVFAFHMWTEVWIGGRWIPLDATLGRGHVGATHLKITDASWHDTRSMTPLLPVLRVLGKVSIEVVAGS